jgi:acyl-coenzyme A thioesterase PaaI-like protein
MSGIPFFAMIPTIDPNRDARELHGMNEQRESKVMAAPAESGSEPQRLAFAALASRGLPIPMAEGDRRRWQDDFNRIPAMRFLGCELDLSHGRVVQVHLPEVLEHHQGGMGTEAVNGAVIAGLCDCALGVSGVLQLPGKRAGTVELDIKFMRPTVGRSVIAYAVALKKGGSVVFAECELYCRGRLCAIATGMVSTASNEANDR